MDTRPVDAPALTYHGGMMFAWQALGARQVFGA